MGNIYQHSFLLATATALSLAATSPANAASLYSVTNLGVLGSNTDGTSFSRAYDINNNNQVVGTSSLSFFTINRDRPFIWDSTNGIQSLLPSYSDPFGPTDARGINDKAQVVGLSTSSRQYPVAFIWDSQNGSRSIPSLAESPVVISDFAYDINNQGQVVGKSDTMRGPQAFLWKSSEGIQNLGALGPVNELGYSSSTAYGINDKSEVVGVSNGKVVLWDSTNGIQDLGFAGTAYNINNRTQVVGSLTSSNGERAFLWEKTTGVQDLGVLGVSSNDNSRSIAYGINAQTQVVGVSSSAQGDRAFVWENGVLSDLNDLVSGGDGWLLTEARAINDAGYIVGTGTFNGQTRGFLLTPLTKSTPEPTATLGLLVIGGVSITLWRRRKLIH
ncbi:MAG: DUF3466 family protein [Scytonema sp. PMC 1070.18]|nr:DUF3466 family protein [Scytonema sp. PMC 1070.18]